MRHDPKNPALAFERHPHARAMFKAFGLDWKPNAFHGYDAVLETKRPYKVEVRTCAEGPDDTLKVHLFEREGWLLYTLAFDYSTPVSIVRAAVKQLIKEEGMR